MMKIEVNGERREVSSATLEHILSELGFDDAKVATAVNGDFVPVGARAGHHLAAGDRVEILAPMQGG